MDNLFEYLIFLFFIISLLNSIFKKKKKNAVAEESQTEGNIPQAPSKKRSRSILEEILSMGLPAEMQEKNRAPRREIEADGDIRDSQDTWFPEKEFGDVFPPSQKEISSPKPKFQELIKRNPRRIKKTGISDKSIETISRDYYNVDELKKRIRNPATFREYILVSEILNKPKALRR